MEKNVQTEEIYHMTEILAETGVLLISNGANSTRTVRNLQRIAETYGYTIENFFSHSAIVLTVHHEGQNVKQTFVKTIRRHGVNYSIVSEISILSWQIASKKPPLEGIEEELHKISTLDSYPKWMKNLLIALATASLCMVFGGDAVAFFIAFLSGLFGVLVRNFLLKYQYNFNICWLLGALVSVSVVNIFRIAGWSNYEEALSACVLWLIPGVPLINGFLDVFAGHIVSGLAKIAMGFLMVFMIALGFYISLFLFGYGSGF